MRQSQRYRKSLSLYERVANIVLHPLLLTTYAIAYNCFMLIPSNRMIETKSMLVLGFFLMTAFFPAMIGLLMKRAKVVKKFWHATDKKDRRLLILVDLVFYTSTLSLTNTFHLPFPLKAIPLTAIVLMLSLLVINLFTDIVDTHFATLAAFCTHTFLLGAWINLNVITILIASILLTGIKAAILTERHHVTPNSLLLSISTGTIASIFTFLFILLST